MKSQSELIIIRDTAVPLQGGIGGDWNFSGAALTASTAVFHGLYLGGASIELAEFGIVWNPLAGPSGKGVELVMFDGGPSNIVTVCQWIVSNHVNPIPNGHNMTALLNGLINSRTSKHFGIRTVGDSVSGVLVYSAQITIVWN